MIVVKSYRISKGSGDSLQHNANQLPLVKPHGDMMTSSNGNIFRITGHFARNSPVTGEFPYKGQWGWALIFSLICAWLNGWVNNREACDLRCHRPHYGVTVMASSEVVKTGLAAGVSPDRTKHNWISADLTSAFYWHSNKDNCIWNVMNTNLFTVFEYETFQKYTHFPRPTNEIKRRVVITTEYKHTLMKFNVWIRY